MYGIGQILNDRLGESILTHITYIILKELSIFFNNWWYIFRFNIQPAIYELIKFYCDRWVFLNHPIKYTYMSTDTREVYNTVQEVSATFVLKNRTKGYLPLSISNTSCKCISYDSKPIEWIGKHINYGFQEIVLSPSEWGLFMIKGKILQASKSNKYNCNFTTGIEIGIAI